VNRYSSREVVVTIPRSTIFRSRAPSMAATPTKAARAPGDSSRARERGRAQYGAHLSVGHQISLSPATGGCRFFLDRPSHQ
jgi:hypothetical protein